ncbi:MAG: GDSL-type esterase/lipase family protein [Clostridiales bacterium]|nr:GDSL-type esterase/lipase family protein [Clostridiales bacterium]
MNVIDKARIGAAAVFLLAVTTFTALAVFQEKPFEEGASVTAQATPSPTRLPKRNAEVLRREDIPAEEPEQAEGNDEQEREAENLYIAGAPGGGYTGGYNTETVSGVVFYGDSWMDNGIFKEKYGSENVIMAKGAQWAKYFVSNNLITTVPNARAVLVVFGLNDWQTAQTGLTDDSSYMKQFLDRLGAAQPGIPILISRSPHTAQEYVAKKGRDINPRCDTYSSMAEQYCNTHSGFYYVDTTSCLEDSGGWLAYADESAFHLTGEGYDRWFSAINEVLLRALNEGW